MAHGSFKKMVLKEKELIEPQICKFGSNNCASCYKQIVHSFIFLGGVFFCLSLKIRDAILSGIYPNSIHVLPA